MYLALKVLDNGVFTVLLIPVFKTGIKNLESAKGY